MDPRKKTLLYNVAVMESPRAYDRGRTSTGSSTLDRGSEMNLDYLDGIHQAHADFDPARTFGLPPPNGYDYDGTAVMSEYGHEQYKTPYPPSVTHTATTTTTTKQKYRVLGTVGLIGIVYCATCGGPSGSEPIISSGGPLIGLLSVVAYVILCVLPLSLMIAELCCAFPENGGYAVWAMTAFGPFWGFQVGYWSWISSVLNNAIYPGLIYSTIADGYGVEATSTVASWFAKAAIAVVLALPSYVGVRFVGIGAIVVMTFIILIALMFTVWGFAEGDGAWFRLKEIRSAEQVTEDSPDGGIDWSLLIHALFWSFDGLYDVSVIGGEVINPARTYPRVILVAMSLTAVTYILPYIAAVSADKMDWLEFSEDSYPDIADAIGGSVLHQVTTVASVLSSIGLFSCTLFFQSFLVQGMAQSRLLPGILRKRSARFKTPQYAILFSLIVTIALVGFDFESVLNMTNAFSGAVQIMIVLSMLVLRKSFPYLPRPMKVPGNLVTLSIMLVPAMAVFAYAIVTTLMEWKLAVVVICFAVAGVIIPLVRGRLSGRAGCC